MNKSGVPLSIRDDETPLIFGMIWNQPPACVSSPLPVPEVPVPLPESEPPPELEPLDSELPLDSEPPPDSEPELVSGVGGV